MSALETATAIKAAVEKIEVPFIRAQVSKLGGVERASTVVTVSLDPRESWTNGILENSRYSHFALYADGTMVQLGSYRVAKFRRARFTSVENAVARLVKWIGAQQT